ncbi:MAG: hypothetical protein WAM58_11595 [Candidatus Acidiferrum sp.]
MKDGGVGADTERECENRDRGEARTFSQHADGETRIAPHCFQPKAGAFFAAGFFGLFVGAEGDAGAAFGFESWEAGAFEVIGLLLDVGAKLFVQFAVEIGAMKKRGGQRTQIL